MTLPLKISKSNSREPWSPSSPFNFMQAFVMGIYYFVEDKEKLIRSFEYRNGKDHFILPLDSDPLDRLGYEYFGAGAIPGGGRGLLRGVGGCLQKFFSIKNTRYTNPVLCATQSMTMSASNLL